jgi:3-dehydrosphinganine reductase
MRTFEDKTVYIPGGSSGIGLSAARLLAALGAHVILFARTKERLEKALGEIRESRKFEAQRFAWMQLDVSKHDEVTRVMSRAVEEFGVPDLLINCAGRAYPHYFEEISYEQLDETMKINFYGVWNTVHALVPLMKQRGGYIVNVASIAGFLGVFGYTDYAASKFAIIGFSETLRSELRQYGIRISVLCPPDTDTPGFQRENKTKPEETKAISGTAKLMDPDDVARALIQGVQKGKFMILANPDGRLVYRLKRFVPSLLDWAMDSKVRKVQKRRGGA